MARNLATSVFDRGVLAIAAVFALAAASFAADFESQDTETKILARQQATDPPQLWRVDALSETGAIQAAVYVCADSSLREAFSRTRAEVNGEMCEDTTSPMVKPNGWALRCYAGGRQFAVSAATVGDLQHDFRLDFGLTEIHFFPGLGDPRPISVRQSRHFLRMGACPVGWRSGDQAKPGHRPHRA